jgi:hypothetical protein
MNAFPLGSLSPTRAQPAHNTSPQNDETPENRGLVVEAPGIEWRE